MPEEYTFPNKNEAVAKIELLYHPYPDGGANSDIMEHICTLEEEKATEFLTRLYDLDTNKCITPPARDYGFYIARVIYQNGDVEMFGSWHIEFIEKGDSPKGVGAYYFNEQEFEDLFFQYAVEQE